MVPFLPRPLTALRESGLLGLTIPTEVGGLGQGPEEFLDVIGQLAGACGSTAMIYLMHVSAAMPMVNAPAGRRTRTWPRSWPTARCWRTLAFSEKGSRSHFWAPVSQAERTDDGVRLAAAQELGHVRRARRPVRDQHSGRRRAASPSESDLYAILGTDAGIKVAAPWSALGLRGNASSPMAIDATVAEGARLGERGAGFADDDAGGAAVVQPGQRRRSPGPGCGAVDAAVGHVVRGPARAPRHVAGRSADDPPSRRQGRHLASPRTRRYLRETARSIAAPDDGTLLKVHRLAGRQRTMRRCASSTRPCACAAAPPSPSICRSSATSVTRAPDTSWRRPRTSSTTSTHAHCAGWSCSR